MLHKNDHDQNQEGHEEAVQQPDIYELGVGGGGQGLGDGALQRVHHQHGRDYQWDGRLEVFSIEINSCLET